MSPLPKIEVDVEDVGKIVDDVFSTAEERDAMLTRRQQIDTTSPYMLPHLIRPIIALVVLAMQLVLFVAIFLEIDVPQDLIWQVGALNGATIGFYFNSRRQEKIQAKNAAAAVEIEEMRARAEVKASRKQERFERRQARRDRRAQN